MPEEKDVVYSHLARLRAPSVERQEQLRSLLGDRAMEDDAYLFDAEISNTLLDSHYTHMSVKTLENYVEDASRGVAFLRGHNWRELPIGYSLEATLGEADGRKRVVAGFYTVRGIADTDDLIKRMEARLVRDVSVGFHGGRAICDLCGADFWDCRHFPGLKYETKEGDTVKTELATFTIDDARLSEVSGVFDGSTPEAMVRKAEMFAFRGKLTRIETDILMQKYRVKLPANYKNVMDMGNSGHIPEDGYTWAINENGKRYLEQLNKGEKKMDEKQVARLKEIVVSTGLVPEDQRSTLDNETLLVFADKAAVRLKELEPLAAEGRQYRTDMVAAAVAEGVRAHGNDFDTEGYTQVLNSSPLSTVKRMTADWKKVADASLPAGRHSVDKEERTVTQSTELIPDEAYV